MKLFYAVFLIELAARRVRLAGRIYSPLGKEVDGVRLTLDGAGEPAGDAALCEE